MGFKPRPENSAAASSTKTFGEETEDDAVPSVEAADNMFEDVGEKKGGDRPFPLPFPFAEEGGGEVGFVYVNVERFDLVNDPGRFG